MSTMGCIKVREDGFTLPLEAPEEKTKSSATKRSDKKAHAESSMRRELCLVDEVSTAEALTEGSFLSFFL
jgi:hypothetical protein